MSNRQGATSKLQDAVSNWHGTVSNGQSAVSNRQGATSKKKGAMSDRRSAISDRRRTQCNAQLSAMCNLPETARETTRSPSGGRRGRDPPQCTRRGTRLQ